jgi:hypothetical protein
LVDVGVAAGKARSPSKWELVSIVPCDEKA